MNIRRLTALWAFFAILCASTAEAASLSYSASGTTIGYTFAWSPGITVEQAMKSVGPDYVATWSHQYSGYGLLMVLTKGSFPTTPPQTNGKLGTPYWLLCIDGTPANLGMSQQTVPSSYSNVQWYWTSTYACK